jgi:outer membrane protein TolC
LGQPAAPRAVTLDEAVRRALEVSPLVVRGAGAVRAARSGERVASGAYLPDLTVESNAVRATPRSANPSLAGGGGGGALDRSAGVGVASTVELFTAGRRGAERRRAHAVTVESEASLVARRYAAVLETKRAFFDVLRSAELLRVSQARVARAEEGLAAASLRHRLGTATGSDELRARLELSRAKQEVLVIEAARHGALFALGRAVGTDGPVDAQPPADSLRPTPLPVADTALVAEIVRGAPVVRAAAAGANAAGAGVSAARSRYAPGLQLGGGYRWVTQPGVAASATGAPDGRVGAGLWNLQLGLSYPLFDGFRREDAVQRAAAERDAADADLADARRAARADAERVLAALRVAAERIALAEEAVRAAREDLRVMTARYRAGAASALERITSQVNLATAEQELVTVRYDYQVARAELEALAGRGL